MGQPFVKNPDQTVAAYLKKTMLMLFHLSVLKSVKVLKESENFADEVSPG